MNFNFRSFRVRHDSDQTRTLQFFFTRDHRVGFQNYGLRTHKELVHYKNKEESIVLPSGFLGSWRRKYNC